MNKIFGARMQNLRKKLKISQEEFGSRIGVSRNHVGRIERGETSLPLPLVEKIIKALKTSSQTLLPF